jgi:hypothetical protein
MDGKQIKVVYTVVERGGKSYWIRIGIGSVNRDGSINLNLDAMPVNGSLQIRDYEPREEHAGNGRGAGNGAPDERAGYGARANA